MEQYSAMWSSTIKGLKMVESVKLRNPSFKLIWNLYFDERFFTLRHEEKHKTRLEIDLAPIISANNEAETLDKIYLYGCQQGPGISPGRYKHEPWLIWEEIKGK